MESFEIQVDIEGQPETLLVIPDQIEKKYTVFDDRTAIGVVWQEVKDNTATWCAEGLVARELLDQIGGQIEAYQE